MLRANLDIRYWLVNGAMGTGVDIVYARSCKSPHDLPLAVMDFGNYRSTSFSIIGTLNSGLEFSSVCV